MRKQDKILKKVSPLSKNVKAKLPSKKGAVEKHFLPDHHFKNVKVKKGLNGLGLFAGENIKKGELIIEYIGNILTDKETDKIPDSRYIFSISKNHNIDGTPRWNLARYCNHSCDGNAESEVKKKRVFMRAIKDIKEGEEIVYDYGQEYFQEFLLGKCMCGAEKHLYSESLEKVKKENKENKVSEEKIKNKK